MQEELANTPPHARKAILVLSSTYPRWKNDHEPNFVHELSKRIAQHHNVTVISPREKDTNVYEELDGVHIYRHRYAPNAVSTLISNGGMGANVKQNLWKWCLVPTFILSQLLTTYRIAKRIKPDIIHAHWIIPQGLVAIFVKTVLKDSPPLIITSHGADLYTFNNAIFSWIKRLALNRADSIAVVSPAMKDHFCGEREIHNKISVLPMGVDTEELFTARPEIPRNKDQMLFIGRLVEKKGLEYLMKAMPEILKQHSGAKLVVIGDGPNRYSLQKMATELAINEHVDFLGSLKSNELVNYYQESSVFIAPFITAGSGDREGLGLVIIEALSCNCPVIVSKNESLREIQSALSKSKWMQTIPQKDAKAIAKAVTNILANPEIIPPETTEQLQLLRKQYSWTTSSNNYLKAYNQCLNLRNL